MIRIGLLSGLLALSTGCMTLDFMVFSNPKLDAYEVTYDIIPEEQVEWVTFPSEDGTVLHGAWLRHDPPAPPLIYFHGNGGHIQSNWDRTVWMWENWGYDVFIFDYRGFGRSEGEADFEGVFEQDGMAGVQYVLDETGVAPADLPWVTISLGSGVAMHTNDEIEAQAIIVESMFASTEDLLDEGTGMDLPTGWFWSDIYDNVEATRSTQSPLLIIHGLEDDFINPDFAQQVYDAAPNEKELWQPEGVNHADLWEVKPEEFTERALDFYDRYR